MKGVTLLPGFVLLLCSVVLYAIIGSSAVLAAEQSAVLDLSSLKK